MSRKFRQIFSHPVCYVDFLKTSLYVLHTVAQSIDFQAGLL